MPNCAPVGCTNRSKKKTNLSFHEYVMSDCKILRGMNPFGRISISVPRILKNTLSKAVDVVSLH